MLLTSNIGLKDNVQIENTSNTKSNNLEFKEYNPYVNNNGSVLGLIGKDYMILAADTRLSIGYSIISRDSPKIFKLTEKAYLASSGMYADMIALVKNLRIRIDLYKSRTKSEPTIESLSQLLSITLYSRRFFPYYTFNLLGGVNNLGQFSLYGYDAVGSFDKIEYGANGSGRELIVPIMDSLLKNPESKPNIEKGYNLALTAMNSCANRDIYTGDYIDLVIIYPDGRVETKKEELRHD